HQDEPAVGAVLRRTRLRSHVAPYPVRSDANSRAVVHHTAHHVEHRVGDGRWNRAAALAAEPSDDISPLILDARDEDRLSVMAIVGKRTIRANHLEQRYGARAQPKGGHHVELTLDAHPARV